MFLPFEKQYVGYRQSLKGFVGRENTILYDSVRTELGT